MIWQRNRQTSLLGSDVLHLSLLAGCGDAAKLIFEGSEMGVVRVSENAEKEALTMWRILY